MTAGLPPTGPGLPPRAAWVTVCLGPPWHTAAGSLIPVRGLWRAWASPLTGTFRLTALAHSGPATGTGPGSGAGVPDRHLWADTDTAEGLRIADCADVVLAGTVRAPATAHHHTDALVRRHPGCLLAGAATRGGIVWRGRTGEGGTLAGPTPGHLLLSLLHAWTVHGGRPDEVRGVLLGEGRPGG
ncbi:hypothetical protein AB0J21_00620 [Streptomyces sp. NPDC049954]|uniref:hypothetical protein n=1 Tax=Streptomyces sp. NPDC049954 TaxID=3155779 RepID=UPI00343FFD4D